MEDNTSSLAWLADNLKRNCLNPIEEAEAIEILMDQFGCSQEEIAHQIGKSQQFISARLSLLRLADSVQTLVATGVIKPSIGRELATIPDKPWQIDQANKAILSELTLQMVIDSKKEWQDYHAKQALRAEINLFLDLHPELQPFRRAITNGEIEYFHNGGYLHIRTTHSEFTWQTWHWPKYSGQVLLIGTGGRTDTDLEGLDDLMELDSVQIFSPDEWQEFCSFDEVLALRMMNLEPVKGWGRAIRWPNNCYQFRVDLRYRRDYDPSYGRFLFEMENKPCFVKQGWGKWLVIEFNDGQGKRTRRRFFAHDYIYGEVIETLSNIRIQYSSQLEYETQLLNELQAYALNSNDNI
jgi:KorB domain